jgi:hypothetical protein
VPTSPLDVVQAAYTAPGAKDLDRLRERCEPAVVLTQDPSLPWGGRFEGTDGVAEFAVVEGRVTDMAFCVDTAATHDALAP